MGKGKIIKRGARKSSAQYLSVIYFWDAPSSIEADKTNILHLINIMLCTPDLQKGNHTKKELELVD